MKKLILLLFISLSLLGCSNSNNYSSYEEDEEQGYDTGNPYSSGTGHYAGYEWAEEKGVSSCGGNSQSFIEGCEEYLRQMGY